MHLPTCKIAAWQMGGGTSADSCQYTCNSPCTCLCLPCSGDTSVLLFDRVGWRMYQLRNSRHSVANSTSQNTKAAKNFTLYYVMHQLPCCNAQESVPLCRRVFSQYNNCPGAGHIAIFHFFPIKGQQRATDIVQFYYYPLCNLSCSFFSANRQQCRYLKSSFSKKNVLPLKGCKHANICIKFHNLSKKPKHPQKAKKHPNTAPLSAPKSDAFLFVLRYASESFAAAQINAAASHFAS